ncbi:anti-sigma factor [Micromonospora sp. CPCC 206061]|uniref:anti-sigma factor n=1 Tax=Micromonospora sp. CPCC 206061 TaxID=3122410 RepID=UPI002FF2CE02
MTDVHALAGAYVLHALTDIERASFARHLSECEACATEVAELQETAARLADGTWSVPPPQLRDKVLAEVRRTRQVPPGQPDREATPALRRWRRRTAAAVAAGIIAAAAGTASFVAQEQRVRDQRATAAAARAEAARIEAVLGAPDARLRTGTLSSGGRVTMVLSDSRDEGVVVLAGVAPPGPGKTYQLWAIDAGGPESMGVVDSGAADATQIVSGVRGMQTLGVTLEPAPGSKTPTLPPLATVAVA